MQEAARQAPKLSQEEIARLRQESDPNYKKPKKKEKKKEKQAAADAAPPAEEPQAEGGPAAGVRPRG